jgi:hypothetical protein
MDLDLGALIAAGQIAMAKNLEARETRLAFFVGQALHAAIVKHGITDDTISDRDMARAAVMLGKETFERFETAWEGIKGEDAKPPPSVAR